MDVEMLPWTRRIYLGKFSHLCNFSTVLYLSQEEEVFTLPGLIHMDSIRYSMWNPWNHCWLRPQPIYCSMDIMDSMWNDHGMVMEWLIPYGIQLYSTWIPLDSIWNLGISTLDSMEQVHMDSMEQVHMDSAEIPYGKYHDICCQK